MSRLVTITTLSFRAQDAQNVEKALEQAGDLIDLAAHDKPDLIVLPEAFAAQNRESQTSEASFCHSVQAIGGSIMRTIAEKARTYRCYIATPLILERTGRRYNSIVLLDRDGTIQATYHKCYPPIFELEEGRDIRPGTEPVTVDTDFGRLGFLVCFDLNFGELLDRYRRLDVDLAVFCSMFSGGLLARAWALLTGCYLVSSFPGEGSLIVNPLGRVLGRSSLPNLQIMTRRIDMDYVVLHLDYNQPRLIDVRTRFGDRIDLEIDEEEGRMILTCRDPNMTAGNICAQIGLEDLATFFRRSLAAREQALKSGPLTAGPSSW